MSSQYQRLWLGNHDACWHVSTKDLVPRTTRSTKRLSWTKSKNIPIMRMRITWMVHDVRDHGCANHNTEGKRFKSPIHCCDVTKPPYLFSGELCTSTLHCKLLFVYTVCCRRTGQCFSVLRTSYWRSGRQKWEKLRHRAVTQCARTRVLDALKCYHIAIFKWSTVLNQWMRNFCQWFCNWYIIISRNCEIYCHFAL